MCSRRVFIIFLSPCGSYRFHKYFLLCFHPRLSANTVVFVICSVADLTTDRINSFLQIGLPSISVSGIFQIQRLPAVGAEPCVGGKHRTATVTAEMPFPVAVIQSFCQKSHTAVGTYALLTIHHRAAVRTDFYAFHYLRAEAAFLQPVHFRFHCHSYPLPS